MISRRSLPAWPCLLLGGLAFAWSNGNRALPWAVWLAYPLLLRFSRKSPPLSGLALLLAVFTAASLTMLWPMLDLPAIPPAARAATALAWGLLFTLPFVLDRLLAHRLTPLWASLALPASVAAVEWLTSLTPDGSWGALAYTQYGVWPLMQLATLTGSWGLGFLIAWWAAALNRAWEGGRWAFRPLAVFLAVLGLVLAHGFWRLGQTEHPSGTLRLAAVLRPTDLPGLLDSPGGTLAADSLQTWIRLLERSGQAARAGAGIVVWQEYAAFVGQDQEAAFLDRARVLARAEGVQLVLCYALEPSGQNRPRENQLVWIDAAGRTAAIYRKAHPSALLEPDLVPGGADPLLLDTGAGLAAAVICTDQEFPGDIRRARRAGAGLLLIPSLVWPGVNPLHTRMAAFRAVENGLPLFKVTGGGLSALLDARGRPLPLEQVGDNGFLVTAPIPAPAATPFTRVGDVFAWTCLGLLLGLTVAGFRNQGRSS